MRQKNLEKIKYEFNFIRDIPYVIPIEKDDVDHCCNGKHIILLDLLKKEGMEARPRFCEFKWSLLENLPSQVQINPHADLSGHIYLEGKIDGKWRTIDATWDKGVYGIFPINTLNEVADMKLAVVPLRIYSPKQSLEIFLDKISESDFEEDLRENGQFYKSFNDWLASERIKAREQK